MISIDSPPSGAAVVLWAGMAALLLSVVSYLRLHPSRPEKAPESSKAVLAKAMREAYQKMESAESKSRRAGHAAKNQPQSRPQSQASTISTSISTSTSSSKGMYISKLLIYPIKSLRGCEVPSALLTRHGFHLDRRFMLLKSIPATSEAPASLENMHVATFPSMCLFTTRIASDQNTLVVAYTPPNASSPAAHLEIPLELSPEDFQGLEKVRVNMHSSPTTAYNLGSRYNHWFSEHFGFPVVLAYWGFNPRPVLGNLPFKPAHVGPSPPSLISRLPILGPYLAPEPEEEGVIAFNDCAPYLVISDASVREVSTRLPEGIEMDVTKFRANFVVAGPIQPYDEDYWSELSFLPTPSAPTSPEGDQKTAPKIHLTANCGRCTSLNVSYDTGAPIRDSALQPLKLLQKDRRVDAGVKYSPIFGRYGFANKAGEGQVVRVGDEVVISGRNGERTKFYWPGLST